MDVKEIIHNRIIETMEETLNYLIKDKDILLTEESMNMIYNLSNSFSEQITDFVIANNRTNPITGTGADSASAYHHSTWQI
jgi:hypothetical protein